MSRVRSSADVTSWPSTLVMMSPPSATGVPPSCAWMSPPFSPAFAAGLPAVTRLHERAALDRQQARRTRSRRSPSSRRGRRTGRCPLVLRSLSFCLTVSIGIAKPMPTLPLPPPPVSICELMPMTRPVASSSGPPELPGLIAASVWMTLSIVKPLGALIWRCSAETTPVVSVRSRPNGLPIAIVGSPTCRPFEEPSAQRLQVDALGVDLQQREVGRLVDAERSWRRARRRRRSARVTFVAPSTTWALVRMCRPCRARSPSRSRSPAAPAGCRSRTGCDVRWTICAVMNATPGASRL